MKLKVYAIQDSKAELFLTPFFMKTDGEAIRAFSDLVMDERSRVSKHPEDYRLYRIGEYDDVNALLVSENPTVWLSDAKDYVA